MRTPLSVKTVNTIVKLVTTPPTLVLSVKETESMLQLVLVTTDISKLLLLNVQNVHTNVTLVKELKKTVFLVPKTEFILHFVPAQPDIITLMKLLTVQLVTKNV